MSIKGKQIIRLKNWIKRLEWELEKEKAKNEGYEEVVKMNGAYISVLLKKLGATEDNKVDITASELKEALNSYEARAVTDGNVFSLYYAKPMGSGTVNIEKAEE